MENELTNELNKLIREEENLEMDNLNPYDKDDDDIQSSMDIEEFEKRINNKAAYDSDDDFYDSKKSKAMKSSKDLLARRPPTAGYKVSLVKSKRSSQPKDEDKRIEEIIISKNDTAKNKKLKELVLKNKDLCIGLEREKNLRTKLEKELIKIKLEAENNMLNTNDKQKKGNNDMGVKNIGRIANQTNQSEESQDWKKKSLELDKKVQELRVQTTSLKNELNKVMRIISRDIGDKFDIDQVLSEENSWKGRAQQIEVLKAKIKDLQSKVNSSMSTSVADSLYDVSTTRPKLEQSSITKTSIGVSNKADDKRKNIESLRNNLEELKAENESLQSKAKGINSRKTILENELKEIKSEYEKNKKILLQKSENDDKFINALKQEIEKIKNQPVTIQTKVIYRDRNNSTNLDEKKEVEDNIVDDNFKNDDNIKTKLKQDIKYMKLELDRKEAMINQLLADKMKENSNNTKEYVPSTAEQEKIMKLENSIKILLNEKDELTEMKINEFVFTNLKLILVLKILHHKMYNLEGKLVIQKINSKKNKRKYRSMQNNV